MSNCQLSVELLVFLFLAAVLGAYSQVEGSCESVQRPLDITCSSK